MTINCRAKELLRETTVYLGPGLINDETEFQDDGVTGNHLDIETDSYMQGARNQPRREKSLKSVVIEILNEEMLHSVQTNNSPALSQNEEPMAVPLQNCNLDTSNTIVLKVMRRGRLFGQVDIRPSLEFDGRFLQDLKDFCTGNPKKFGRRITKVHISFL